MLEQGRIGLAGGEVADGNFHPPPLLLGAQLVHALAHEIGWPDQLLVERLAAQAGEGEQVVNKEPHALGVSAHGVEVVLGLRGEGRRVLFEQNARETVDRPQWSAQVMRDVSSGGLLQSNVVARGFNNIFSGALQTLNLNELLGRYAAARVEQASSVAPDDKK